MTELYKIDENGKLQLAFHYGQSKAWASKKRFVFILAGSQSGKCLRKTSLVLLSDGRRVMMQDIQTGDEVMCLGENLKVSRSIVTAVLNNGVQAIYRVTTRSGRETYITAEHPLYGVNGWTQLKDLQEEDFIGVPRDYGNLGQYGYDENKLKIIGYMLGDGGCTHSTPMFTNMDEVVLNDLASALPDGVYLKHVSRYDYRLTADARGKSNPIIDLIKSHGMNCLAKNKRIPEVVFSLNNNYIAIVLNALFACDSWIDTRGFGIALASEGMIDDIRHLLLRFGVNCRKRYKPVKLNGKIFDSWALSCADLDGLISLAQNIGILGKQEKLERVIDRKMSTRKNTKDLVANLDVNSMYAKLGTPNRWEGGYSDQTGYGLLRACRNENVSRPFAQLLSDHFGEQQDKAYSDIYWDRIKSIEYVGKEEVMDLTVENGHNFIADDVFLHNTSFLPWILWREIQEKGGGDYLAVSPSFPLLDKKMLPEFIKVFHATLELGKWWAANKVYEIFDPETGEGAKRFHDPMYARIMFCSAKNADSLESATAKAAVLDEVGQDDFTVSAWEAVQRRLTLNRGRVFGATTIYNWGWMKNQIYDTWKRGESSDIDVIQFRSIANPMFPRDEYFRAMKTMPLWKFRMFYDGEYDKPAGMIYDSFDSSVCVVPDFAIPDTWQIFVGVDFGGVHMAALFVARDPETKRFYHYKEYIKGGLSIKQHADNFREIVGMRPMRWIGGAAPEDQWRKEFIDAGIPLLSPPIKEVEVGIQRVYNFHRRNQIYVFKSLVNYLDQKGSYSRKLNEDNEPTEEIKDKNEYHLLDCERVLFSDLWEKQGFLSEETLKSMGTPIRNRWTPPTSLVADAPTTSNNRWTRGRKF